MLLKFFPSYDDDFYGNNHLDRNYQVQRTLCMPAVNVFEKNDNFEINLAAPGLSKNDIKIDLDKNQLTISSEKTDTPVDENEKCIRKEFCYKAFKRVFTLPDSANSEGINANYENGILKVTIPKKEEAVIKPSRQISIA